MSTAELQTTGTDTEADPSHDPRLPLTGAEKRAYKAKQQLPKFISYFKNKLRKEGLFEYDLLILYLEVRNYFKGGGPLRSTLTRTFELTDETTRMRIWEKYGKYRDTDTTDLLDMLRDPGRLASQEREARLEALGILLVLSSNIRKTASAQWTLENGFSPF